MIRLQIDFDSDIYINIMKDVYVYGYARPRFINKIIKDGFKNDVYSMATETFKEYALYYDSEVYSNTKLSYIFRFIRTNKIQKYKIVGLSKDNKPTTIMNIGFTNPDA